MKTKKTIVAIMILFSMSIAKAQIKNAQTESVTIYGNCGMCERTIEKAGSIEKVALVDWDKSTKMATLTYDSSKTSQSEILKRIALSGYDSDQFLAPDDVYAKLPACCQYERVTKTETVQTEIKPKHDAMTDKKAEQMQAVNQLNPIFNSYFSIKDALVSSDGNLASTKAKELFDALSAVQMNKLSSQEHLVWMQVMKDLKRDSEQIDKSEEIAMQRMHFISLSENMYQLLKVSKQETTSYYQYCPMANKGKGANWLSKTTEIKNPYYGSQMLTCGKTIETIE